MKKYFNLPSLKILFVIGLVISTLGLTSILGSHSANAAIAKTPIKSTACTGRDKQSLETNYKSPYDTTSFMCLGKNYNSETRFFQFAVHLPGAIEDASVTAVNGKGQHITFDNTGDDTLYVSIPSAGAGAVYDSGMGYGANTPTTGCSTSDGYNVITITVTGNGKTATPIKFNLCSYPNDTQTVVYNEVTGLTSDGGSVGSTGNITGLFGAARDDPIATAEKYAPYEKAGIASIKLTGPENHSDKDGDWYSLTAGQLDIEGVKAPGDYTLSFVYNDKYVASHSSIGDVSGQASSSLTYTKSFHLLAGATYNLTPNGMEYRDTSSKVVTKKTSGDIDTASCGSQVPGLGWLVCPIINGLTGLNDGMWGLVSGLLTVNPLEQGDAIFTAWGTIRNVANVAFVIIFLIVIFSQLSSIGISNYGVKKMLPRLIIGAILVNLSFFVVQIAVDIANILGSSIYTVLVDLAPKTELSWAALVNLITQAGVGAAVAGTSIALVGGAAAAFWMLLPIAAVGALGLLAAVVTLIFRQAAIPILAILAPLAFVAYLLPNTGSWYKKWQGLMVSMLMLYPLAALLFGGVQFAARAVIGDGSDWWKLLIGLVMLTLPLFSLPFLARQGGPILSKVGGTLGGLANKARSPLNKVAQSHAELAKSKYMATPGNRFSPRGIRQGFARRAEKRSLLAGAYKAQETAEFNKDIAEHADKYEGGLENGSVAQTHVRALTARAQAEGVKLAMDSMKLEPGFNLSNRKALAETLEKAIDSGDETRTTAAMNYLVAARGVDELQGVLSSRQGKLTGSMGTTVQRSLTSAENGGVVKERRPDLTRWASSTDSSIDEVSNSQAAWGGLSPEDVASLSIGSLETAFNSGGISRSVADTVFKTPTLLGKLDKYKEAVLTRIRNGEAPPSGGSTPSYPPNGPGPGNSTPTEIAPEWQDWSREEQARQAGAGGTPSITDSQGRQAPATTKDTDDYHEGMTK